MATPQRLAALIDTTGDGVADSLGIDTTGDGKIDSVQAPPKQSALIDTTGDGVADSLGYDTTGDGKIDTVVHRAPVTHAKGLALLHTLSGAASYVPCRTYHPNPLRISEGWGAKCLRAKWTYRAVQAKTLRR